MSNTISKNTTYALIAGVTLFIVFLHFRNKRHSSLDENNQTEIDNVVLEVQPIRKNNPLSEIVRDKLRKARYRQSYGAEEYNLDSVSNIKTILNQNMNNPNYVSMKPSKEDPTCKDGECLSYRPRFNPV